jgi:putative transposase
MDCRGLRTPLTEQENSRLKKLLADSMLDNAMLKEISAKKF